MESEKERATAPFALCKIGKSQVRYQIVRICHALVDDILPLREDASIAFEGHFTDFICGSITSLT